MATPIDDLRTEAELKARISELTALIGKAENERRVAAGTATEASISASQRQLSALADQARALGNVSASSRSAASSTEELNRRFRETSSSSTSVGVDLAETFNDLRKSITATAVDSEKALEAMSISRRNSVQGIVDLVGGSSQLVIQLANNAKNAVEFSASQSVGVTEKMVNYFQQMGDESGALFAENNANAIAGVNSTNQALMNSQAYMTELYAQMLEKNDKTMINGITLFEMYGGEIGEIFTNQFGKILSDPTIRKAFALDFLDPAQASKNVGEYTKTIELMFRGLGVNSEEMKTFVEYNLNKTGKASLDYAIDVAKSSEAAAQAFGLNSKEIEKDIVSMTGQVGIFGFRSASEFAAISASATASRMSIGELQGVMQKFETLQSATDFVGRLNSLLGTNLDAISLMQKRYSDIPGFVSELSTGLKSSGMTFEQLISQQAKFAEVLKITGLDATSIRAIMEGNLTQVTEKLAQEKEKFDASKGLLDTTLAARAQLPEAKPEDQFEAEMKRQQEKANIGLERVREAQRANSDLIVLMRDIGEKFGPPMKEYSDTLFNYNKNLQIFGRLTSSTIIDSTADVLSAKATSAIESINESLQSQRENIIKSLEKSIQNDQQNAQRYQNLIEQIKQASQPPQVASPAPVAGPQPVASPTPAAAPSPTSTTSPTPATPQTPPAQTTSPPPATPGPGSVEGRLAVSPNNTDATITFSISAIAEAVMQTIASNPAAFGSLR